MSWRLHLWVWQLRGPLVIGMAPTGALNRCRPYVPARAVWGALTSELAQAQRHRAAEFKDIGETLRESARFSYLFPGERVQDSWKAWLPRFERDRGLLWVREDDLRNPRFAMRHREFRHRLLEARAATAIDPDTDSAADGSLRETECISPRWRSSGAPVALIGYVFSKNGLDLKSASTLFLGGDTRYGLGRVERVILERASDLFGATLQLTGAEPVVQTGSVLAHAAVNGAMYGALERVLGWDRSEEAGLIAPRDQPLWSPGSQVMDREPFPAPSWVIEADGTWTRDSTHHRT